MSMTVTDEEKQELEGLLSTATEQRLALDQTLSAIEDIAGGEIDNLDELVGNGIDADGLLAAIEDTEEDEEENKE